ALPPGMTLVTASAAVGSLATNGATITWSVGPLNAGGTATMTVVAKATAAGEPLTSVQVSSSVYDPAKANNFRQTRIEVTGAPSLAIGLRGSAFNLNWGGSALNFWLEGTTSLSPPVQWVQLTSPGVQTNYTLSPTNIYHFFRLKAQVP